MYLFMDEGTSILIGIMVVVFILIFPFFFVKAKKDFNTFDDMFSNIEKLKGKTYNEIVETYGAPQSESHLDDGKKIFIWGVKGSPLENNKIELLFEDNICTEIKETIHRH